MDFIILLSAVLKHVVICRKLQKIAPFGIVIDLWKCGVCVCVSVCVHTQFRESLTVCILRVADFHPRVCGNLEVKYG